MEKIRELQLLKLVLSSVSFKCLDIPKYYFNTWSKKEKKQLLEEYKKYCEGNKYIKNVGDLFLCHIADLLYYETCKKLEGLKK